MCLCIFPYVLITMFSLNTLRFHIVNLKIMRKEGRLRDEAKRKKERQRHDIFQLMLMSCRPISDAIKLTFTGLEIIS